jgi:hypothetical protein
MFLRHVEYGGNGQCPRYCRFSQETLQEVTHRWRFSVPRLKALTLLVFAGLFAAEASADETGAQLSFFESRNGKTEWMIWSAATNRTDVSMELADAPSLVFWESKPGAVLFVSGGKILQADVGQTPAKPKQVAALPGRHGEVRTIWRDAASSRLRAATMLPIEDSDVLDEKGTVKYRLPDGRKIDGMTVPDWGAPFACSVLELQADGKTWKLLTTVATKDEAGDTPGISVVDDLRNEAGYSSDRLSAAYYCGNGQCGNAVPKDLVALALRLSKRKQSDDDEFSIWRPGPGLRSVVFGTGMGDSLHMVPPVIILSPDEKSGQNLPLGDLHQLAMGVEAGLLLVSHENGAQPVVVDLKTGQVRFRAPEATSAVWVPKPSTP